MKCPHCQVEVHPAFAEDKLSGGRSVGFEDVAGDECPASWRVFHMACPSCRRAIIFLRGDVFVRGEGYRDHVYRMIYPKGAQRPVAAPEVPEELSEDFNEACTVLADSPKASAALSRRCLQGILRAHGFTQHDLAPAIQAALDSKSLPSHLAQNLDAIRNIGNFAAHPMKNTNTGEVLPVEPHEAEWNLDVLEGLFDFYYVQPAKAKARRDALNAKIAEAGKPPLKG